MSSDVTYPSVRRARRDEIPQLAGVLARAFETEPLMAWMTQPDDDRRAVRTVAGFSGILRYHSRGLEETWTTDDLEGAAVWRGPGRLGDSLFDQLRLLPSMTRMIGLARLAEVSAALRIVERRHRQHMPEPHFYLLALGVDPPAQRRGIGGRLLSPVLVACDERHVGAYLETVGEPNRRFYERHGFEVVERLPIAPAAVEVQLMRREPR